MRCNATDVMVAKYTGASLHKVAFLHILRSPTLSKCSKRENLSKPTIIYAIYSTLMVQSYSKLLASMLVILLDQHPIILGKLWIQKYGVILNMSCDKLIVWPGYCQHLGIKQLSALPIKTESHAKEPHAKLHVPTLKLNEPIEKSFRLPLVSAKQIKVLKAVSKATSKAILKAILKAVTDLIFQIRSRPTAY